MGACCSWCGIEREAGTWPLWELHRPWWSLRLLWVFSVSAQLQRVKLCCFPSDLPLFCCRSYSSTSIEEAMKRGEDPPTPPPRPQKTHSRASSYLCFSTLGVGSTAGILTNFHVSTSFCLLHLPLLSQIQNSTDLK